MRMLSAALVAAWLPGLTPAADPETVTQGRDVARHFQETLNSYRDGDYEASLEAARESLRLLTDQTAIAHNNICSAQIQLGRYDEAIEACRKALEIAPEFERAQNNLAWIFEAQARAAPSTGVFLNLSEIRYRQGALDKSIDASERALQLDPESAIAHNNLCAAYAKSERWRAAIRQCERALALQPDYELARNNLLWARSGKDAAGN